MAKTFEAKPRKNIFDKEVVLVDGNPITDIVDYNIKREDYGTAMQLVATVSFLVTGSSINCGDFKKPDPSYLDVLRDDMAQAKKRLQNADPEGEDVVLRELNEIAREISRYSAYLEANSKNEEQRTTVKDDDER